jgi:hypothetical protein
MANPSVEQASSLGHDFHSPCTLSNLDFLYVPSQMDIVLGVCFTVVAGVLQDCSVTREHCNLNSYLQIRYTVLNMALALHRLARDRPCDNDCRFNPSQAAQYHSHVIYVFNVDVAVAVIVQNTTISPFKTELIMAALMGTSVIDKDYQVSCAAFISITVNVYEL